MRTRVHGLWLGAMIKNNWWVVKCASGRAMGGLGCKACHARTIGWVRGISSACHRQIASALRRHAAPWGDWGARHAMHVRFGGRGRAAAGCPLPASFHAGCQSNRSVESPWLAMEFIAGSRLLLSRSRLRLYRQINIAHTLAFIGEHQSTTHLCVLCVLCAR